LGSAEDAVAQGPKIWLLQRRKNIQADSGSEQEQGLLRDWERLSKRLPSVKRSRWKAAVQKAKECEEKNVEQKRTIPVTQPSKVHTRGIRPQEAEEEPPRSKSPPKILESPKSDEKMAWRRNYYLRSRSPTPPAQPLASKTDLAEPNWVKVLGSSATQVWSMVKTFRERGNHEIAASLEAAAEKQAEAVLRTQQINVRPKPTSSTLPVQAKPVVSREPTPIKSPVRVRVRRSAPSSPVPAPAMDEEEKRSSRAESEWESEDEETSTSASTRPPSVHMEPPSPASSTPRSLSPLPLSPSASSSLLQVPKNPHSCYHSRLKTYERSKFRWGSPSPSELSEAGFFFTGPRDAVQCFSCETAQNQWKPAEDPWVRHGRRSPSCDYVIEMRGTDFVQAIIDSVEKVKNTLTTYTRTASNSSVDKASPEFTKMKNGLLNTQAKLRETKTPSSTGWRLDPYKERGVAGGGGSNRGSTKKKKKKSS